LKKIDENILWFVKNGGQVERKKYLMMAAVVVLGWRGLEKLHD